MRFSVQADQSRCKGCGLCVAFCLRTVLRLSRSLNARSHHVVEVGGEDRCEGCRRCTDMCPEAAIEIARENGSSPSAPAPDAPGTALPVAAALRADAPGEDR